MKLARVDECVFVIVESVCAYGCVRMATEGEREAGLGGIQISSRGRRFRIFFTKWILKGVHSSQE